MIFQEWIHTCKFIYLFIFYIGKKYTNIPFYEHLIIYLLFLYLFLYENHILYILYIEFKSYSSVRSTETNTSWVPSLQSLWNNEDRNKVYSVHGIWISSSLEKLEVSYSNYKEKSCEIQKMCCAFSYELRSLQSFLASRGPGTSSLPPSEPPPWSSTIRLPMVMNQECPI